MRGAGFVALLALLGGVARADYANVGGLKMYYEVHGAGPPLLLLHGGDDDDRVLVRQAAVALVAVASRDRR